MMTPLQFLLLEDQPLDAEQIRAALADSSIHHALLRVDTRADFVTALETQPFDLILAAYTLSDFDGIAALEIAHHRCPETPFIFVSASLGEELAIDALKAGASNYVLKQRLERLVPAVQRALREAQERQERKRSEQLLIEQKQLLEIIATGQPLDDCLAAVCASLSRLTDHVRACFLLTDAQCSTFPRSITPDLPPSFGQGLKDAPINDLCIGTCGEAVYRGEPITCVDIANDDRWSQEWRSLCLAHGILACHSRPVMGIKGLPLGSLMLCFDVARMPTTWEYQLAEFGTQVASLAFEREHSVQRSYRVEAALQDSEEQSRNILASITDAFLALDENWRFTYVNEAAYALLDRTPGDLIGKDFWEEYPGLNGSGFEQMHRGVMRDRVAASLTAFYPDHDRWYEVRSYPAAKGITTYFQNVTDQIQAEATLRNTNQTLQTLIQSSPLPIVVIKPDCTTTRWNPAAERVFGWSEADVLGKPLPIVPADKLEECRLVREAIAQGKTFFGIETYRCRRDGSAVVVSISAALLENSNEILLLLQDITERQQAEQALQQREAELRLVTNTIPALISFVDADQRYRFNNQRYEEWFGHPAAEIYGKSIQEVLGEAAYEGIRPYVEQVLAGQQVTFESQVPYKKGGTRDVRATYVPRYNPQGTVEGFVALISDISEQQAALRDRKRAEAALHESESRFRLMVESAKEYAILTTDLDGVITSWNAGAERLLGYQEADIVGRDGRILYMPQDNEWGRAEQEMQIAQTQGRAINECWHVRKDGSRFWGSGLVMPLQSEAGTMQGFIKIMQDKTAQRQSEQRFQLLYDTTSDLLVSDQPLTLMGNLFRTLSAQLELDYYYNYLVEEKDGRPMLHLRNYEGLSEAETQSIEWIELGQYLCGLVAQEQRQIVLDQAQLSAHPNAQLACSIGVSAYAGQPLIVQGRLLGTLSFASRTRTHFTSEEANLLQSVCDQMAIALQRSNLLTSIRQQAEQLQRANQIKDEFLAVLSHELRSPLNPILGWTRLLQNGKLDEARRTEALKTIERNARLQSQLIEDLLDISRIMQGKLSLTAAPTSLIFVISAAVETVRLAAEAKNIQITLDLDLQIPSISGDAARLQQVVWNLLTNAVKFTPNGGQVTVELRQLDHLAQIRVIDTGKGINPQFLPHVFEYFRQEDGSTTRRFGGLGLGLAIVCQIVELHGGTVWAESRGENQGATFMVQLPLLRNREWEVRSSESKVDSLLPTLHFPLTGLQILLVDDEPDTREFQAFLLEQSGAKVTAVASGLEALQSLDQFIPDAIVSDIGMANMDGYMLMQQIRARPPNQGGQVPAIALTAYARDLDQQKARQVGFQTHITKPVEPEALVEAITILLR